jgi:hypothetical protein
MPPIITSSSSEAAWGDLSNLVFLTKPTKAPKITPGKTPDTAPAMVVPNTGYGAPRHLPVVAIDSLPRLTFFGKNEDLRLEHSRALVFFLTCITFA